MLTQTGGKEKGQRTMVSSHQASGEATGRLRSCTVTDNSDRTAPETQRSGCPAGLGEAGGCRGRGHRSSEGSGLRLLLRAHCGQGEGSPLTSGRGGGSEDAGPALQQHRPRRGRQAGCWAEGPDVGPGWSRPARRSLAGSADDSPHAPRLPPATTRGREGERLLHCWQQGGALREAWGPAAD